MGRRILKHAVGTCICGSSAVFALSNKYPDKQKHWSVTCCNPDCRKHTPGFNSREAALNDWNSSMRFLVGKYHNAV